MTKIFIDVDVILDFLTERQPFSIDATSIFTLIDKQKINGYTSALTYSNLYYVLRKYSSHKKVIGKLEELTKFVKILKVDERVISSALTSEFNDFEDAIQYYTAQLQKRIVVIITRNIKDYKASELPVMKPDTFLKTYEQTTNS